MTEMKIPKDVVYGILKVPIPVRRSQIRKTINKGSVLGWTEDEYGWGKEP